MRSVLLLSFIMSLGFSALAEDRRPQPRRGGEGKAGSERMMDRLRERDPDGYAELLRLRESDPEAFRAKMRELFEGRAQFGGKPKSGSRAGAASGDGVKFGPKGGRPDMRRGPHGKDFMQKLFDRLGQHDPEKAEKLKALSEEDPEAFRLEVRKMLTQRRPMEDARPQKHHGGGGGVGVDRDVAKDLRERFVNAPDAAARESVRLELRGRLGEAFDGEVERQQERLEAMTKQIEGMRVRLEARRAQRDELVEEQVDRVLNKEPGAKK